MSAILTYADMATILAEFGAKAEYKTARFCTAYGTCTGLCAYLVRDGKRLPLGMWGALNQHSEESLRALVERKLQR